MDITQLPGFEPAAKFEDESSVLGAAGRGAAGMIPLGEQAVAGATSLATHKTYAEERQALRDRIKQDIDTQPEARLAGQVAGVVAPIVATAGMAAPETLLGAAGQGALFGGAFGAGNAIDTMASGGSGMQAAGDVALGAATGAAGGAAGYGAGKLLGKAASTILPSPDEVKAHAIAGVVGGTPRQFRALPGKDPLKTINEMGDVLKGATVGGKPLVEAFEQYPDRLRKFIALQEQSGKVIGDTIESAGVEPIGVQPIVDSLNGSMKIASPPEQAHMASVIDHLKTYANADGKIPFQSLQKLKSTIGDQAFHGQGNPVLQNAYHVISDVQDAELEKASSIINKPGFDQAKKQYQAMSRFLPMLKMAVTKEVAGKSNLVVPGAALVTGHPIVAGGALLKPRLEQMMSGTMFKAAGSIPAGVGESMSKLPMVAGSIAATSQIPAPTDLHLKHPSMAPWKPTFDKNAANAKDPGEVAKSHAVTDFTLSQRDPAYAKAKQEAVDNPQKEEETPTKMAEGGLIAEIKDAFTNTEPIKGMGSTLEGLHNVMAGNTKPEPKPEPEAVQVYPKNEFHRSMNPQLEEQLKAYLMGAKKEQNEP